MQIEYRHTYNAHIESQLINPREGRKKDRKKEHADLRTIYGQITKGYLPLICCNKN